MPKSRRCGTGCVLQQWAVPSETNEAKAALPVLRTLVLEGRVITGDAMFCQKDVCQTILDSGGDYFVVVKDNQPTLQQDIAADFEPAFPPYTEKQRQAQLSEVRATTKEHGRQTRKDYVGGTVFGSGNVYFVKPDQAPAKDGDNLKVKLTYANLRVRRVNKDTPEFAFADAWNFEKDFGTRYKVSVTDGVLTSDQPGGDPY